MTDREDDEEVRMTMMSPLKVLQISGCRYCSSPFSSTRKIKGMKTCATRQLLEVQR